MLKIVTLRVKSDNIYFSYVEVLTLIVKNTQILEETWLVRKHQRSCSKFALFWQSASRLDPGRVIISPR